MDVLGGRLLDVAIVALGVAALGGLADRRSSRWLLAGAAAALWGAVGALGYAFATSDLSLASVVDHSRETSGLAYRVAGVWGGMEGSLLLWAAMLASAMAAVSPLVGRRAVGVAAAMAFWVVLTVRLAADPFVRLQIPAISGSGLTPILEHPAMVYHPLILYGGLVAAVVPFVLAVDAVVARCFDDRWRLRLRRSCLIVVVLLTAGLATGANWAYEELGWGGYWAWDPVENTALLPWLAAVSAVHLSRGSASARTLVVASSAPFAMVVFGAMLTRAGATDSVHAFAEARGVGISLTVLLAVVVSMVAALAGLARGREAPRRRSWLDVNTVAVVALGIVVFAGTVWPVVVDVTSGERILVLGDFYARFGFVPVVVGLFGLAVAFGARAGTAAIVASMVALAGLVAAGWGDPATVVLAMSGAAAGGAALACAVAEPGRAGAHLAHLGLAVLVVGFAGSTETAELRAPLGVGETATLGGYSFDLESIDVVAVRPDVDRVQATVTVRRGGDVVATLRPSLDAYRRLGQVLAETDGRVGPLDDVQVVLRTATDDEGVFDLRVRPMVSLVWLGAVVLGLGVTLAAVRSRRDASGRGAGPASRSSPARPAGEQAGESLGGRGDPVGREAATGGTVRFAPSARSARGAAATGG